MALLKSIATVGGITMISRVLGFARDILIAAVLGAGFMADAFFVAFKFTNLFRRLFAEGAFSSAFVPIHVDTLEADGKKGARRFTTEAFSMLFWTLLIVVVVVEAAMPWAMRLFAPGFLDNPERFDLVVRLSRITFPYLFFVSLVALLAGLLNAVGRFAAAAAAPILLNLCLIAAALLAVPHAETPAHALAYGLAAAGVVQFVWLLVFAHRAGVGPVVRRPRLTEKVRRLLKRVVPMAIGAGAYQVNLVVDTVIASFLPSGAISYLYYAHQVSQLPLGVVGVAVGTALLPLLARQLKTGEIDQAHHSQNRALEFAFFLTLPAAAALVLMAEPVILTLFERGAFGPEEAKRTAQALTVYAVGVPAYVSVKVLSPNFFAREDTKTPVLVSLVAMIVNIVLNLMLMGPLRHVGIAVATTVSAWINAILLGLILRKRGHLKLDQRFKFRLLRAAAAVLVMTAALWALFHAAAPLFAMGEVHRAAGLAMLVIGGMAVYFAAALGFGAFGISDIGAVTRRSS